MEQAQAKQRFTVSHYDGGTFKREGLRGHAAYRDLGIAEATDGLVQAHVIHLAPGVSLKDVKSDRHYHDVQFQMVYCLRGWMKLWFEGHGEHVMQAGSCWIQPSGLTHQVLDRSEDYEVLEIIMPAQFDTVVAK